MKKTFTILALISTSLLLFSQVGINTNTIKPGVALEISSNNKGVMLPKVDLQAKNIQAPLVGTVPTGTLIFNSRNFGSFPNEVNKGFYWWDNENKTWMPMANSLMNVTCQFKNQETTFDFHSGSIGTYHDMDLFANSVFNENYSIYEKLNVSSLKINMSGLYAITVNLDMFKANNDDPEGLSTRIVVNNIQKGTVQYWRSQENENEMSHHFTEYLQLTEGDIIKIQTAKATTSTSTNTMKLRAANTSDITIQRIR